MTAASRLARGAQRRLAVLNRRARDWRYLRVMGRFVREGLLVVNHAVTEHDDPLHVADVLWAGEVEPRLLELLPALLVKRPALFHALKPLPDDLARAVAELRRDREPAAFRGIPGGDLHRWLARVGRKGRVPARLKSFRFRPEDQRLLEHLTRELDVSETEVIRRGLRALM